MPSAAEVSTWESTYPEQSIQTDVEYLGIHTSTGASTLMIPSVVLSSNNTTRLNTFIALMPNALLTGMRIQHKSMINKWSYEYR